MSENRNTIPPNSATVLNEPLNETAEMQVVDPALDPEAPTNVDEPIAGDILESALPTASSASSIAHLRALNTSGESVNIAPNSIADLALRTANKTKVQTLAGMDYSLLTEQIVHGEYWIGAGGTKKRVYMRTFKGQVHGAIGGNILSQNCFSSIDVQLISACGSLKGYFKDSFDAQYNVPLGHGWDIWTLDKSLVYITTRDDLGLMTYIITVKYAL